MSTLPETNFFGFARSVTAVSWGSARTYSEVYKQNRHRIYALAFWLTDSELAAEELMTDTFCRAFAKSESPAPEDIDCALILEARRHMPFRALTLNCAPCEKVLCVRDNMLRIDLDRAVVRFPNTEKMIFLMHDVEHYDHARIARILGFTEDESHRGLHQARLRIRELLAK